MIQNYRQLEENVKIYNDQIADKLGQVQKIYSTPHLICITIRFPGKTLHLYLGRGGHYEGLWGADGIPPSNLRIKDRFLEYLRKYLRGGKVGKIFLDEKDRILQIPYSKMGKKHFFCIFWRGRSSFFINIFGEGKIFKSWLGEEAIDENIERAEVFEIFDELGRGSIEIKGQTAKKESKSIENYISKELDGLTKGYFPRRKQKYFEKKEKKIKNDLERVRSAKNIRDVLEDPEFEIGDKTEVVIEGVKFKFARNLNEYKKRDRIYQKIKGLKKGEAILVRRLEEVQNERENWEKGNHSPTLDTKKIITPVWNQAGGEKKIKESKDVQVDYFKTLDEVKLAIGRDTSANDYLRNKWANKEDYWFHLEGHKSPHLIVKCSDLSLIPFAEIGSIIRDYSKLDISEIPLVYTQVRHLKGLKGKSGSVTFKKAKYIRVEYNENWPEKIIRL